MRRNPIPGLFPRKIHWQMIKKIVLMRHVGNPEILLLSNKKTMFLTIFQWFFRGINPRIGFVSIFDVDMYVTKHVFVWNLFANKFRVDFCDFLAHFLRESGRILNKKFNIFNKIAIKSVPCRLSLPDHTQQTSAQKRHMSRHIKETVSKNGLFCSD